LKSCASLKTLNINALELWEKVDLHPHPSAAAHLHYQTASKQILRAEISCSREETGFSYRDFKEKSLFRVLETGVLAPCLLATWDTYLCYTGFESRLGPHVGCQV